MPLQPYAYRLWQDFFVAQKLRPLIEHPSFTNGRSLCELGCGPGTNYPFLSSKRYVGIDLNSDYIRYARESYGDFFFVHDINIGASFVNERFDIVLIHSVLHHLCDDQVELALAQGRKILAPGGTLHLFDVELPPWWSLSGCLARLDNGEYIRRWPEWEALFSRGISGYRRTNFSLRLFGLEAYRMFHLVWKEH